GLIVPGSTLMYGSSLRWVILRPRFSSRAPSDAEESPLPSDETTPPVTKRYLVRFPREGSPRRSVRHALIRVSFARPRPTGAPAPDLPAYPPQSNDNRPLRRRRGSRRRAPGAARAPPPAPARSRGASRTAAASRRR